MKVMKLAVFWNLLVAIGMLLGGASGDVQADEPPAPVRDEKKPRRAVIRLIDAGAAQKPADACCARALGPPHLEAINALLARKVLIDVDDMKLGDFVKALSDVGGIQVVLDRQALEVLNVTEASLVNFSARDLTLGSALTLVLHGFDPMLRYMSDDTLLKITTAEVAQEHLLTRAYNVRELVTPKQKQDLLRHAWAGSDSPEAMLISSLCDLIQKEVEPASWDVEGGNGRITNLGPDMLVVSQTDEIQLRVAALLEALCAVRQAHKNQQAGLLPPRSVATQAEREFAEQVRKAMAQPVQFNFKDTPLDEVMATLSQDSGLTIMLEKSALEAINITGETPVTIKLREVPLRSALKMLLRSLDPTLAWSCHDEALFITTREESAIHHGNVVYPVRDLTDPDPASGMPAIRPEALADVIEAAVEPSSWRANGGEGDWQYYAICDGLVVANTDEVQAEVTTILDDLRKMRRLQSPAPPEAKAGRADAEPASAPADGMEVVVYHLAFVERPLPVRSPAVPGISKIAPPEILGQAGFGGSAGGTASRSAGLIGEQDLPELKQTIIEITGAENWPVGKTSLRFIGNQLIIRQTPAVHRRIHNLLNQLNVLAPDAGDVPFVNNPTPVVGGFGGGGGFGGQQGGFGR